MASELIRKTSETPNINNYDDARFLRYAYGNQNGYQKGVGDEFSYSISAGAITINSGVAILQGWEVRVDSSGVVVNFDNVSEKRFNVVYLKINLLKQTATFELIYSTSAYPSIPASNDLSSNVNGVANMEMYRFESTNGVASNVDKRIGAVEYTQDVVVNNSNNTMYIKVYNSNAVGDKYSEKLYAEKDGKYNHIYTLKDGVQVDNTAVYLAAKSVQATNATKADNATRADDATRAKYASTDTRKGTIEERLTKLGFRQGSISLSFGTATENSIKAQGKYAIFNLDFAFTYTSGINRKISTGLIIGTVPDEYMAKTTQYFVCYGRDGASNHSQYTFGTYKAKIVANSKNIVIDSVIKTDTATSGSGVSQGQITILGGGYEVV